VYCWACCESLVPPGANMCFDGADMALLEMGVRVARWDGLTNALRRFIGLIVRLYVQIRSHLTKEVVLPEQRV
jgi:hypothetical protein